MNLENAPSSRPGRKSRLSLTLQAEQSPCLQRVAWVQSRLRLVLSGCSATLEQCDSGNCDLGA